MVVPYSPVILSVPNSFEDGTITGNNLNPPAGERATLLIHLRVRDSAATGDYGDGGRVGRENLLGDMKNTNEVPVPQNCIQQWNSNSITLRFTKEFWETLMSDVAMRANIRGIKSPQQSDIEVGYQIKAPDEVPSKIVYAK